jgi:hypothetical protein
VVFGTSVTLETAFLDIRVRSVGTSNYPVLGKALRVLGHAELFEPVRNLLHRGPRPNYRRLTGPSDGRDRELIRQAPASYAGGQHRPRQIALAAR